ncbi:CHAT domain-containing protein [Mycena maculata]|uniref:CHAT domain-containing protein n=1 Tax=Mycena maculata TaxID=230809 RepID=A0AAD7HID0_9AGAR|nr:CHAT domain-containing protein [Mycena maculata]KAJ7750710.1 CHAT domain-containing protein [Mycena maculata]
MSGIDFFQKYRELGNVRDLEVAVRLLHKIVDRTPADDPMRAGHLQMLALCLTDRYQRSGNGQDLKAALQRNQEAVNLTPLDHPQRAGRLQSLAASFRDQYQRFGDLGDLEAALQIDGEAVDLTPVDHPERSRMVQSLAVSFRDRYKRLGDLGDLDMALQKMQEAVKLTSTDHPVRAERLSYLAVLFRDRYQRLGDLECLEAALHKMKEALDLTPVEHPDRAGRLQSLAVAFGDRYRRLGDLGDLEAELQKMQEAVDLTPTNYPDRAGRLRSLAISLRLQYQRLGDKTFVEAAPQRMQEANSLTTTGHPERARRLQSLAVSFQDRYQRLGDSDDLEAVLERMQEAVDLTPTDHPERGGRLQSLALAFQHRYNEFQEPQDLRLTHQYYSDSFTTQGPSDPEPSWWAALAWANFSKEAQPFYCSAAYIAAFNLLPELLWIGHTIPVRQDAIRRLDVGHTASAATKTCIGLSDLASAVQLIEQGLATTFQQMLQLRPDLDSLPPDLAKDLQKLSYALYSGTATNPTKVAHERTQLLQEIRKQPGHEYFLLPKPYKVLCHASRGGPIVILNSHADGCDGIIIPNPTSKHGAVAFPNANPDLLQSKTTRADSQSTRLNDRREGFSERRVAEDFDDLLTWLWKNIVDLVYQILAKVSVVSADHGIDGGRIWWLPTGLFTGLPLHASTPKNDPFIHSYTATLGSLLEGQARGPACNPLSMGVVGVTHTGPGYKKHLPCVRKEVQKMKSIIQSPNVEYVVGGVKATPEAVKRQLLNCSWIHLACHGTQDLIQPTKSRLLLYDGALELETILRMPLPNAEFVFLAACQTAMGDVDLVNESFHLGGGFIAAGFRGAIGTLWSITDEDGPLAAETVYSHLFRDGRRPQASDAAESLHLAVNKLKEKKVPYERWIPFIHMGV